MSKPATATLPATAAAFADATSAATEAWNAANDRGEAYAGSWTATALTETKAAYEALVAARVAAKAEYDADVYRLASAAGRRVWRRAEAEGLSSNEAWKALVTEAKRLGDVAGAKAPIGLAEAAKAYTEAAGFDGEYRSSINIRTGWHAHKVGVAFTEADGPGPSWGVIYLPDGKRNVYRVYTS